MTPLEFDFNEAGWTGALEQLMKTEPFCAARFLTLMEGEDEESFEEALQILNDRHILPELSQLPVPACDGEAGVRLRREQQLVREGMLLKELSENDPLRLYLEELAEVPTCGDVQVLADRLLSGDRSVTQQLTNGLLSRVVERSCELTGRGVLLLDLIQEGSIGLWQGILSYTGGNIEEHCDWQIRWDLARAVMTCAREKGVGQKLRQAVEDYRSVDEQLLSELGRNPTLEEIAQRLHLTVDAAAEVAKTMEAARMLAMAKQPQQQEPAPEDEQAVEDTAYFQMRQRIADLLSDLDEADAQLLTLRFGLEGGKPMSPDEVGKKLGLTPEEAVEREAAALMKLRKQ
jgi:RNA polymerase primary sigma factor